MSMAKNNENIVMKISKNNENEENAKIERKTSANRKPVKNSNIKMAK